MSIQFLNKINLRRSVEEYDALSLEIALLLEKAQSNNNDCFRNELIQVENRLNRLKPYIDFIRFVDTNIFHAENSEPPRIAEVIVFIFTKKRYRAGLLACLEEDFRADLTSGMSLARAKRRYWAAALNSIGPQLWAAIKRIGLLGAAVDYIRGKLG